jgi:hypothetical protein
MRLKMAHVANLIHELLEMLMLGLQSLILANYACHIVKLCYGSCNGNTQSEPCTVVWSCAFFQVSRAAFRVSVFVTTFAGFNHKCCRGQLKQIFVFMVCLRIQDNSRSVVWYSRGGRAASISSICV